MSLQDFLKSGTCSRLSLGLAPTQVDVFSGYSCLQGCSTSCYVKPIKLACKEVECASSNKGVAVNMLSVLPSSHGIFPAASPLRPMDLCCCQEK